MCAAANAAGSRRKSSQRSNASVADGVVEIMLLGQNVNSYGKNLEEPMTFAQLLRKANQIEG